MNKFKKRDINIIKGRIAQLKDMLNLYENTKGAEDLCLNLRVRISECKQMIERIQTDLGGHK